MNEKLAEFVKPKFVLRERILQLPVCPIRPEDCSSMELAKDIVMCRVMTKRGGCFYNTSVEDVYVGVNEGGLFRNKKLLNES